MFTWTPHQIRLVWQNIRELITDGCEGCTVRIPASKSTNAGFSSRPAGQLYWLYWGLGLQASLLLLLSYFPTSQPGLLTSPKRSSLTKVITASIVWTQRPNDWKNVYQEGRGRDSPRDLPKRSSLRTSFRGLSIGSGGLLNVCSNTMLVPWNGIGPLPHAYFTIRTSI